jgi:hypothetical protein
MLHEKHIPGNRVDRQIVPGEAAATDSSSTPVFVAPFDCTLVSVEVYFGAKVAGDDTNRFNLNLIDRGADGAGTVELGNYDLTAAKGTVDDMKAISLYSTGTATLSAGDVLDLQREKVGSGLIMPNTLVVTTYKAR